MFIQLGNKKIVFYGDSKVGKTQLISRWVDDSFSNQYKSTIGIDYKVQKITESFRFTLYDTAGKERFKSPVGYSRYQSDVLILVFSVTDQTSFTNLKQHLEAVKAYTPSETPIVLLANKIDDISNRTVTKEEAEQFARENALHYYEISAKDGFDVKDFQTALLELSPAALLFKPNPPTKKELLHQKINKFKTDNPNNKEIQAICDILEGVINADTGSQQDDFEAQAPLLKQHLDTLRWNFKSIVNSVMNLIATVFGLPLSYCCGCLEANKNASGDSWMFFKFGEHQASKVLCNQVLAEAQIDLRM
ncbi:MAG: GTP-binding protein [Legionellaceae bacterium]|nr:GTP-binding protein [Legionellaceae bacterium]MBP9775423.1 GTP-binding protein [Legionellaceae bacterium]